MVGDLPLIGASHWQALGLGYQYWRDRGVAGPWSVNDSLVHIQRVLHQQGQGDSVFWRGRANSWQEGIVALTTEYICRWSPKKQKYSAIPYHPDILPHWEAFSEAQRSGNEHGLKIFQIHDIQLPPSPFFANKLVPILNNNITSLTGLELRSCNLVSSEIVCISQFLSESSTLATLDLSANKDCWGVDAANSLAAAMKNHPALFFVNLSKCNLGRDSDVLSAVLDGAVTLKSLLLEDNNIGSDGVALIADFLAGNTTALNVFSLDGNDIGADNAITLSRGLKKNKELRQLCLGSNNIPLPTIIGSKRVTINLTHIDLNCNYIKTQGANLIAAYLERNPILSDLNLESNRIPSSAAKVLSCALKKNTNLQHLNLSYNSLSNKCIPFFADALKNNTSLLSLDLVGNNIKVDTGRKELIASAICDTTSLQAVANSNHSCKLTMSEGRYKNGITFEEEMRNISALDNEGHKIRYKVVLALFAMSADLFNPRNFDNVPLELMPYLLEIAQQQVGYNGFGKGVVENVRKRKSSNTLRRLYEVVHGWNIPLLFVRGPGKLKKKRKRKSKKADDDEWTPNSRGKGY
ncbi:hypothetical protein ACHAXR_011638 [Thalassiosira sp. AJA248-18]